MSPMCYKLESKWNLENHYLGKICLSKQGWAFLEILFFEWRPLSHRSDKFYSPKFFLETDKSL